MKSSRFLLSSGISLFETALVFPFLIVILFGAWDVTRTLFAYNALNQALDRANQDCLKPGDGECNITSYSPAASLPKWEWYKQNVTPGQTLIPKKKYQGEASWIDIPQYRFTPSVNVLTGVSYDTPLMGQPWQATRNMLQWEAQIPYFAMPGNGHGYPYVSGTANDPNFWLTNSANSSYPATRDFRLNPSANSGQEQLPNNLVATNGASLTYEYTSPFSFVVPSLTVPAKQGNAGYFDECYLDNNSTNTTCSSVWPGFPPSFQTCFSEPGIVNGVNQMVLHCDPYSGASLSNVDAIQDHAYIVLKVEMEGATDPGATGGIQMLISSDGVERNLDGRGFSTPNLNTVQSFGFSVRGLPCNHYISGYSSNYNPSGSQQAEASTNACPPGSAVSYAQEQAIKVRRGVPVQLRWRVIRAMGSGGGSGNVYAKITRVRIWYPEFSQASYAHQCPGLIASGQLPGSQYWSCGGIIGQSYNVNAAVPPVVETTCPNCSQAMALNCKNGLSQSATYSVTQYGGNSCFTGYNHTNESCPGPGSNNNFTPNSSAANGINVCPPTDPGAVNAVWSSGPVSLPTVDWSMRCNEQPPISGPGYDYSQFSSFNWGVPATLSHIPFYTNTDSPPAEYSCISPTRLVVNDTNVPNSESTYFNLGGTPDLGCSQRALDLTKAQAVSALGLDPKVHWKLTPPPTLLDDWGTPQLPLDECTMVRQTPGTVLSENLIDTVQGAAIPVQCQNQNLGSGERCSKKLIEFVQQDPTSATLVNAQTAIEQYAFRELQANLPSARLGCTGANCTNITVDPVTAEGFSVISGSLELPLISIAPFQSSITLRSQSIAKVERKIATE